MKQYTKTQPNGDKYYYKDSAKTILHRLDGPAVEHHSGYKAWYVNGKRHRLNGPAIEGADGSKAWYVNGKQHRLDGPAVEGVDGSKVWYVNDEFIFKTNKVGSVVYRMQ